MKGRFVSCGMVAIALFVPLAMVTLGSLRVPAQNDAPTSSAKTSENAFEREIMDEHCAQMGSHQMTMKETSLATADLCTTYCIDFRKTKGRYVLYNAATKMIYQLDDQQQAMFFGGRKVRVTGTYNPTTKTVHVKDIQSVGNS